MRASVVAMVAAAVLVSARSATTVAQRPPPAAPASSAPDLKTVLFDAANALGMLRGLQQEDSITTFEFWATGSATDAGRPIRLSSYRASVRFRTVPGMRVDFSGAPSGGPPERAIHVVAGTFAWNETEPGLHATPAPEAAAERMLLLATLPQSVVKGAVAAGDKATLEVEAGGTSLAFPVPGLEGATLSATLNAKHLIERVVTRLGDVVTETSYADYRDLNERDYKADILFPRRIVQKRSGVTLLDLTVTKTNTYNPYVIMPVPDNVAKSAGGSS